MLSEEISKAERVFSIQSINGRMERPSDQEMVGQEPPPGRSGGGALLNPINEHGVSIKSGLPSSVLDQMIDHRGICQS